MDPRHLFQILEKALRQMLQSFEKEEDVVELTTNLVMLSEAAEKRNEMVAQCIESLQHLAYRAENVHGMKSDEFVVVCIKVDSFWRDIVDLLMPDADWQQFRGLGQEPVVRGTVSFSFCKLIARRLPDIADLLLEKPTTGMARCIALDEGGGTVYEIEPLEQQE